MDLYVYYRVSQEHAAALQPRIAELQQCIFRDYGIVTGLKRRPEEKNGRQTWMEIYLSIPNGFEQHLDAAVMKAGVNDLIDGLRNAEYFVDLPPCV